MKDTRPSCLDGDASKVARARAERHGDPARKIERLFLEGVDANLDAKARAGAISSRLERIASVTGRDREAREVTPTRLDVHGDAGHPRHSAPLEPRGSEASRSTAPKAPRERGALSRGPRTRKRRPLEPSVEHPHVERTSGTDPAKLERAWLVEAQLDARIRGVRPIEAKRLRAGPRTELDVEVRGLSSRVDRQREAVAARLEADDALPPSIGARAHDTREDRRRSVA
jgi:hypothetical protein